MAIAVIATFAITRTWSIRLNYQYNLIKKACLWVVHPLRIS